MRARQLLPLLALPFLLMTAQSAAATTLLDEDSEDWRTDSSGDDSPDGIWDLVFPGSGEVEIDDGVLQLRPDLGDNSRHSALVLADEIEYEGIHGKMEVRLDEQSGDPENWDSFWAMLAYVDSETQINFLLKTDDGGWKVTKRDHDHEGQDLHQTLAEGDEITEAELGEWYELEWWIAPNGDDLHLKVAVNGEVLMDEDDSGDWDRNDNEGDGTSSYFLESEKTIGAYSESSYSSWRNVEVLPMDEWED